MIRALIFIAAASFATSAHSYETMGRCLLAYQNAKKIEVMLSGERNDAFYHWQHFDYEEADARREAMALHKAAIAYVEAVAKMCDEHRD